MFIFNILNNKESKKRSMKFDIKISSYGKMFFAYLQIGFKSLKNGQLVFDFFDIEKYKNGNLSF